MRMHRTTWRWLFPAVLAAALLDATGALAAEAVTLTIQAPGHMDLGDEVTVTTVLTDGEGRPVPGASIVLSTSADFLSVEGAVELDRATTDAHGAASLRYQARSANSVTLSASFGGDRDHSPAQASAVIAVEGSAQLYQQTAGVRLPGVGAWLLVVVLGVAWSTYLGVTVLVTLIARAGTRARGEAGGIVA